MNDNLGVVRFFDLALQAVCLFRTKDLLAVSAATYPWKMFLQHDRYAKMRWRDGCKRSGDCPLSVS